jgi:DNA-binding response OmpR family regulator
VSHAQILLVEDDADLASTLAYVLGAAGYPVRWARTGDEALEAFSLARTTPRLVLLDLGLPDMSGVQFGTRLQAHARPPLILITAQTQEVLDEAAARLQAAAALRKPFDVDSLLKTVRETLNARPNLPAPPRFSGH